VEEPSATQHGVRRPSTVIRPALEEDCDSLGDLHTLAWQQAYEGLIPQWYLDGLNPARRAEAWRQILVGATGTVRLDFDGDTLAGFIGFGPCRDDDATETWCEVGAIYYLKHYWGSGMAQPLMARACDHLRESGYRNNIIQLAQLR
jgi:RimJ/RimL family protein N-acetyltransferase